MSKPQTPIALREYWRDAKARERERVRKMRETLERLQDEGVIEPYGDGYRVIQKR